MDVVYPISNQSKDRDDFELRYSLRSLEIQPWVDKVILVGHLPGWAQGVIHIPCPDPYVYCKDANIINKILRACVWDKLSKTFVVNSDDQLFLKPVTEEQMEPMIENSSSEAEYKVKAGTNNWFRRVQDTKYWCKQNGYDDFVLQSHCPYMVDKTCYPIIMCQLPWGRGNGFTTHVYFNIFNHEKPIYKQEPMHRTIRIKQMLLKKGIETIVKKDSLFLNFNNTGLTSGLKAWIQERFPTPSRWEKGE
jgi:hypothetical protein